MIPGKEDSIRNFIRHLPKPETHLHIEGALPYELLKELDPEKFNASPPFWVDEYRFSSFPEFEEILLSHALLWFTSAERYHRAAEIVFKGLVEQNCRYVETSFHVGMVEFLSIPGAEIIQAIKSAAPPGLEVRVFAGMLRNQWTDTGRVVIEQLHEWDDLDGIDLHGREDLPLEDWTRGVWERNRRAGKTLKAHAGEFGGPENVRQAIEDLGVRRIQHGIRVVDDAATMELARQFDVTFDVCPISNVKLRAVPSLAEHPIRPLLDAGIRCTVSTDDPFAFGNTLEEEYLGLVRDLGFTEEELVKVARNGFEVALLSDEKREALLIELDAVSRE